jgi:hypothetical protein
MPVLCQSSAEPSQRPMKAECDILMKERRPEQDRCPAIRTGSAELHTARERRRGTLAPRRWRAGARGTVGADTQPDGTRDDGLSHPGAPSHPAALRSQPSRPRPRRRSRLSAVGQSGSEVLGGACDQGPNVARIRHCAGPREHPSVDRAGPWGLGPVEEREDAVLFRRGKRPGPGWRAHGCFEVTHGELGCAGAFGHRVESERQRRLAPSP